VIRYPPAGTHPNLPYLVALIDFENGPSIIRRLTKGSEDPEIGTPVVREVHREWDYLEFQTRG